MKPADPGVSETPITDAAAFDDYSRCDYVSLEPTKVVAAKVARHLEKDRAVLLEALSEIAELDPSDTNEGMNEWGEAFCFRQSQEQARAALKRVKEGS